MNSRFRWTRVLLVVALCLGLTGTALAAFKSGKYKGTTAQTDVRTGKKFPITFKISGGQISKVDTTTRDSCPDGSGLRVHQNAFKSAPINSKGKFTLTAGTPDQPAVMKGKVKGKNASGTITDTTRANQADPSSACHASTTWTAKVK